MPKRLANASGVSTKKAHIELGSNVFACPVCNLTMIKQIFQCSEGHCICEDCYNQLKTTSSRKCPSCQNAYPTKQIRNLALEGIVEQCCFPCSFGCGFEGK